MSLIEIDDRTQETPEEATQRQATDAGVMIARAAYQISGADPQLTLRTLAAALGLGIARTGAPVDEVFELVKQCIVAAQNRMAAQGTEQGGDTGN